MLDPVLLGVDIGSVSIAVAILSAQKEVERFVYRPHRGRVRETLHAILDEIGVVTVSGAAMTSGSPPVLRHARLFDSQISLIAGCRRSFPRVRSIIFVGGEKFGLIRFDGAGKYRGARSNSSCAAGTGSFLDQQARRLGFAGIEELVRRACASTTPAPKISTRCAVFARTDLVHAQQAGYSLEEICDGLCRGLAQNIADTLLGGEAPEEPAVFAGGVALNEAVRAHLEEIVGVPLLTHPHAPVFGAVGAALLLAEEVRGEAPFSLVPDEVLMPSEQCKRVFLRAPGPG